MEFAAWQEWTGPEVAFYISTFCELPQYEAAIGQNISGRALQTLHDTKMLAKGLARAGICDFDHQRVIAAAVEKLRQQSPDELTEELSTRLDSLRARWKGNTLSPKRPHPPSSAKKRRPVRRVEVDLSRWDYEALNSHRPPTATAVGMQRPTTADSDVNSVRRYTPRPWVDNAAGWSSRTIGSEQEPTAPATPLSPRSQRVRACLSSSLRDYETMQEADSPVYSAINIRWRYMRASGRKVVSRDESSIPPPQLASSKFETHPRVATAPAGASRHVEVGDLFERLTSQKTEPVPGGTIDTFSSPVAISVNNASNFRDEMMQGLLGSSPAFPPEEDSAAAGLRGVQKIQSQREEARRKDGREVTGTIEVMSQVLGTSEIVTPDGSMSPHRPLSATRARAAEVEQQHREMRERAEDEAAVLKLQAKQRQRMAMREAELRRANKKQKQFTNMQDSHYAQKTVEKKMQLEEEAAAKRIQAIHRGNVARANCSSARNATDQRSNENSRAYEAKQDETAATKIQAIHRGKKARRAIEEHKSQKSAATKIQANFRGKQERRVVNEQHEAESHAATKIQATFRGKKTRGQPP